MRPLCQFSLSTGPWDGKLQTTAGLVFYLSLLGLRRLVPLADFSRFPGLPLLLVGFLTTASISTRARFGRAAALAQHHQCRREPHQPDASCEAQRQALAGWADGATLGRRWRPRSRQGLPAFEGPQGNAEADRRAPRTRPATRIRWERCGASRVVVNRAAAEIQQRKGHPRWRPGGGKRDFPMPNAW
jgi:hypothetical protein